MASMFSKPPKPNTPSGIRPMAFDLPVFPGGGTASPLPQMPTIDVPQAGFMPPPTSNMMGGNDQQKNLLQQLLQGFQI